MSDGYLTDRDDLYAYVDYCRDMLTHQKARRWVDPDQIETYEENRDELYNMLTELLQYFGKEGRFPERGEIAEPLQQMRLLATDRNDEDLSWHIWRDDDTDLRVRDPDLPDERGPAIGYGGDSLISSTLLHGSAVIKHVYSEKPEPVELTVTKAEQDDKAVYIGSATAAQLDAICKVPWMDPTMDSSEFGNHLYNDTMDENQWQRVVDTARVRSIGSFIGEEGRYIFNPVLLYMNKNQESGCYSEKEKLNGNGVISINFDFLVERRNGLTDYVPLPGKGDVRPGTIIDGQHRIRGLVYNQRGADLNLPFVLIVGDGSPGDQRLIAEIFTQINTKSVPIDPLHKMYLSYKFGMAGSATSDNWEVSDHNTRKPTGDSRPQRRAYELALLMSHHPKSPLYDMIEFQRPSTSKGRRNAHICINALNWVSYVRKWFLSGNIYAEVNKDKYLEQEALNFFRSFEENSSIEWPIGDPRWRKGAGRNKPLLQYEGPFLSLLELYPQLVRYIREDTDFEESVAEGVAIPMEVFLESLKPLSMVDWNSPSLHRSNLKGRTNSNIKHLVKWMINSIKNKKVYTKKEVLDHNENSITGKGLLANPGRPEITKMSGPDWPSLMPLQLRCKKLEHTLGAGWIVRLVKPDGPEEIDPRKLSQDMQNSEFGETHLTIETDIITSDVSKIEVQAFLTNGNGQTLSKLETFSRP